MKELLLIVTIQAAALLYSTQALAQTVTPQICNHTSEVIYGAVGWLENGVEQSSGWWVIQPGDCQTLRSVDAPVYLEAENASGTNQYRPTGGNRSFCVYFPDDFDYGPVACTDTDQGQRAFGLITDNDGDGYVTFDAF